MRSQVSRKRQGPNRILIARVSRRARALSLFLTSGWSVCGGGVGSDTDRHYRANRQQRFRHDGHSVVQRQYRRGRSLLQHTGWCGERRRGLSVQRSDKGSDQHADRQHGE